MAKSSSSEEQSEYPDRCRALTSDGERCERETEANGFCYQHDEDDPTVDERASGGEVAADTADEDEGESSSHVGSDIMAVRETVQSVTTELVGHQLDGIVELRQEEDGWLAIVEVIERPAVPDTQDILGQYEIELDGPDTVSGYHRVDRFHRGDTNWTERGGRST